MIVLESRSKLIPFMVAVLVPFGATLLITLALYIIWRRFPSIGLGDTATVLVTTIPGLAGLWAMSRYGIKLGVGLTVLYFVSMAFIQVFFWMILAAELFGLGL